MTIKVAINGYGRIGRNILRAHYESGEKHDLQIVAINDLGDPNTNVHLTKYDTAHGPFPGTVVADGDSMVVNGDRIRVLAQRNPAELPWRDLGVDVVLECTGFFTTKEKASAHLKGGAKKVIISAPGGKDVDATIVYGVNDHTLKASHTVISNASCTTNCLAPLVKPLHDKIGVVSGLMTTDSLVHERSGADRRLSRGPAPRARRCAQHDSDEDRRRFGGRPCDAGTERQARRLCDPGADDQRVHRRSDVYCSARYVGRRSQRDHAGGRRWRTEGRARVSTPLRWFRATSITTRVRRSSMPR